MSPCFHKCVARTASGVLLILSLATPVLAEDHVIQAIAYRDHESMFFEPAFIVVAPGDSVSFEVDDRDHQPQSVFVPEGAKTWQAEPGEPITVELEREGVYLFDCAFHNVMGMAGVIVVGEPLNAAEARAYFESYRENTFAINVDRLDHIFAAENGLLATPAAQR